MRRARSIVAVSLIVMLTAGAGWMSGRFDNRWGAPPAPDDVEERFARIPHAFGTWSIESIEPLDKRILDILQCEGHFVATYVERDRGTRVNVALIAGPPGPTAVHTPEICYSSRNHEVVAEPAPFVLRRVGRPNHTCWHITLRPNDLDEGLLRVHYAWSTREGIWEASRYPRFRYCNQPLLYKLQLATRLSSAEQDGENAPDRRFLEAFLQELDLALFAEHGAGGANQRDSDPG